MTAIERLQALAAAHTETYVTVPAEDLREVCAARPDDPLARTLLTIAANAEHTPYEDALVSAVCTLADQNERLALSLTHIAGSALDIDGRTVQRCSLCGAKLCDSEGTVAPLGPDGSAPKFPTWPAGRLVQVETGNPTRYSLLPDTDRLPEDSCLEFA